MIGKCVRKDAIKDPMKNGTVLEYPQESHKSSY